MLLGEFFEILSYGELSSLGLAADGEGRIEYADQPKVITHINATLNTLSKKMAYKQDYVKFEASAARTSYILANIFADSNTDPGNTAERYIRDSVDEPFMGGIVKILEVTRNDDATTLNIDETVITNINKRETVSGIGVRVVGADRVILSAPADGDIYRVDYQAAATRLSQVADLTEVIDVPTTLESLLELGTAARVFGAIGNESATFRSQELWQRFKIELGDMTMDDTMSQTESDGFDKLRDKGFK